MDDWSKFTLTVHTNDNAVLAYIDLCGTTTLYEENIEPLKEQAERLYNALLDSFMNALQEEYTAEEIKEGFYINAYADSIMLCPRKKTLYTDKIKRLVKMLLRFQWLLILEHEAIPFRAIIAKDRYFSLHIDSDSVSDNSILKSKYFDVSLCGGNGMISLDKRLKGLPIGTYIEKSLMEGIDFDKSRLLEVEGENLFFVKQAKDVIQNHLLVSMSAEDREQVINSENSSLRFDRKYFPNGHDKWEQWLLAHESKIETIKKDRQLPI